MASQDGSRSDRLTHFQRLCDRPESYHIFLALRILEAEFDEKPQFGRTARPRDDRMRLGQEASMAFPRSTISAVDPPAGTKPGRLTNLFFGLFGPQGPLPAHLTEFARERHRTYKDPTFVSFANMLTHRVFGLMYRAWSAGQPAPSFDRGDDGDIARKISAISGHLGQEMRDRDSMPDLARRHFAGHLAAGPRHPGGLVSILSVFFRATVSVQEFVGCWLALAPSDQWQLGTAAGLGQDTSIGSRVWSRGSKFRIRIGPLTFADYQRLLPGSKSLSRLTSIVREYVGDALDWDVNLVLKGDEIPAAILGSDVRLGQTSWIGEPDTTRDVDDLYLTPIKDIETIMRAGSA
jgi:type VI secretion system protein ImpH